MHLSASKLSSEKRKASMDNMMHQPPLKKLATDSSMGVDIPGASSGYSTNTGMADSVRALGNNNVAGSSSRREIVGGQGSTSSGLDQAWKEDTDAAQLLPLLYEYFGESMLTFVPSPEASLFL